MTDIFAQGYVKQQSRGIASDGTYSAPYMTRGGALGFTGLADQWAREGRVFSTHNPTVGTALTASAAAAGGHVLTAPSIRMTVPTGYIAVPLFGKWTFSAMAGTPNEMAIVASEGDTYTSGGTSVTLTAYNSIVSASPPKTSSVTNLRSGSGSALVEGTLVAPRVIDIQYFARADAVSEPKADWTYSAAAKGFYEYVIGPASLLIYISAVTTASAYEFTFSWAELDRNEIMN
jgi:hypothetical protein